MNATTAVDTAADAEIATPADIQLGPLQQNIAFYLRRAQDAAFQAFARRVGEEDITPGHYALFAIIEANPGLNQAILGRAIGRDKSTLTPILADLERSGLVERRRSQRDRRANGVYLTPAGVDHLKTMQDHAQAHDRLLDDLVGPHHKAILLHLLERIADGLDEAAVDRIV